MRLADLDQTAAFLAPVFALPAERRISWLRKRVGRVGDLLAGTSGQRAESLRCPPRSPEAASLRDERTHRGFPAT